MSTVRVDANAVHLVVAQGEGAELFTLFLLRLLRKVDLHPRLRIFYLMRWMGLVP